MTAAPPEVLADMEQCARALARSVGYVGAGEPGRVQYCAGRRCLAGRLLACREGLAEEGVPAPI